MKVKAIMAILEKNPAIEAKRKISFFKNMGLNRGDCERFCLTINIDINIAHKVRKISISQTIEPIFPEARNAITSERTPAIQRKGSRG